VSGAGGGSSDSSASKCPPPMEVIEEGVSEFGGVLNTIEKRLASHQQDFTQAIHKVNEKENEKFDLIFAILSELQQRQAHLEDSVRSLKAAIPNGNSSSNAPQQQQQGQFPSSGGPSQSYGQMNGQMGVQMPMQQQPMQQQQFAGVMQADGTVIQTQFIQQQMPAQQMIIMSPPANGGMQYAMPQMMQAPTGQIVQQMPAQMAMQFMAQNCSEMGQIQEGCQASGSSIQAQMDMIKADNSAWQSEECSTMDTTPAEANSGIGSSDASSQEGKAIDDGSPCQTLPPADGSMP